MVGRGVFNRRHSDGRRAAPRRPVRRVVEVPRLSCLCFAGHFPPGFCQGARRPDGTFCCSRLRTPTRSSSKLSSYARTTDESSALAAGKPTFVDARSGSRPVTCKYDHRDAESVRITQIFSEIAACERLGCVGTPQNKRPPPNRRPFPPLSH